jgi:hypothetical protein
VFIAGVVNVEEPHICECFKSLSREFTGIDDVAVVERRGSYAIEPTGGKQRNSVSVSLY